MGDTKLPQINNGEGFKAQNWKQLSKVQLTKMNPVEVARYNAYEDPGEETKKEITNTQTRLKELRKARGPTKSKPVDKEVERERIRHEELIGQLKAAEAKNRVYMLRSRYYSRRGDEIDHLINCQPSAIRAVRLQSLLPVRSNKLDFRDIMGKDERIRVESLLEDELGLKTGRIIT